MIFFYKAYKKSPKATFINAIFRFLAWTISMIAVILFFNIYVHDAIPRFLYTGICIATALALIFFADKTSDAIAYEDELKEQLLHKKLSIEGSLSETLKEPATITICRDKSLEVALVSLEYYINDEPVAKLRRGESKVVKTLLSKNIVWAKTKLWKISPVNETEPITVMVRDGEHITLCYSGYFFKSIERKNISGKK